MDGEGSTEHMVQEDFDRTVLCYLHVLVHLERQHVLNGIDLLYTTEKLIKKYEKNFSYRQMYFPGHNIILSLFFYITCICLTIVISDMFKLSIKP